MITVKAKEIEHLHLILQYMSLDSLIHCVKYNVNGSYMAADYSEN